MSRMKLLAASRNRKGFTLIELLVVVLILAILMAVALPLYLSAVADSQKKTCRANMQTIANAVQAAKVKTPTSTYADFVTTPLDPAKIPDLQAIPSCPVNGTAAYAVVVTATGFKVTCSTTGTDAHGKFEPGIDAN